MALEEAGLMSTSNTLAEMTPRDTMIGPLAGMCYRKVDSDLFI